MINFKTGFFKNHQFCKGSICQSDYNLWGTSSVE